LIEKSDLTEATPDDSFRMFDDTLKGQLQLLSICSLGILSLAVVFSMYFARPVFFPIVLAIFLNLLLSPAVRSLRRLGIPNTMGALMILGVALFSIGLGIANLVDPATSWMEKVPQTISKVERKLGFIKKPMQEISKAGERITSATEIAIPRADTVVIQEPSLIGSFLTFTGSSIGELIIAIILTYFLLARGDRFLSKAVELMPTLTDKKRVVEITRSIEENISKYLLSVTVINFCLGVVVGLAMWALNVPNAALWGMMAFLLNFLPYVGSVLGLAAITLVAIISFENVFQILSVPILYLVIDWIEGSFVTPLIIGMRLNLNPPVMLMWILLWGWLWGPWGAILAVPMLAAIKILCDHVDGLKPIGKFLVT